MRILTENTAPTFGNTTTVTALSPLGGEFTVDPPPSAADPRTADFSFANVAAGTWRVQFETPDNHQLLSNLDSANPGATPPIPAGSVTNLLEPGDPDLSGFDAEFVELATVEVNLFDRSTGDPINDPVGFTLVPQIDPSGLTGDVPNRPSDTPDSGTAYTLQGVPVAATTLGETDPPRRRSPTTWNSCWTATTSHAQASMIPSPASPSMLGQSPSSWPLAAPPRSMCMSTR